MDQLASFFKDVGSKILWFAFPANIFIYAIILVGGRIMFFIIWATRHIMAQQLHTKSLLLEILSLEIKIGVGEELWGMRE